MSPKGITQTVEVGGKQVTIETGKLAKQANGSVVVRQGDTMLLCTVVSDLEAKEGVDFLPLTVDYREKFSSIGKFPGGFFKREGRPYDSEILVMRLVDRALRPLFPDDYHSNTQVMIQLISYDEKNAPDSLACLAASSAIAVSNIPFNGPVSEVRVSRKDGNITVNPTVEELEGADYEMMIAGTEKDVIMVEGEMKEISEAEMIEAIKIGHEAIRMQCIAQNELGQKIETAHPKREYSHETHDEEIEKSVKDFVFEKCKEVARKGLPKEERSEQFSAIIEEYKAQFTEEELEEKGFFIKLYYSKAKKEAIRQVVLDEKKRLDGRKLDEVRPIWSEIDYLPTAHGSAIFTRGETQSLTTLTVGGKMDEQMIDGVTSNENDRFLLHYNFPPFSTGEAYPIRGVSRREIGHGNLAMRALKQVVPSDIEYTIRLVSDILESNGSSSMATVCAGCLAMMDGGIPISKPVSGIAMGLISDKDGKYAILSDILGDEDHLGDMDFKITGTKDGITACQMDMKVDGLSFDVLAEALDQAKAGRLHIMDEMLKTISEPRSEMKPNAPRIVRIVVPNESIGAIIGPGGKIIQEIQKTTGTTITLEENSKGEGVVEILSNDGDSMKSAETKIRNIAFPPTVEVGETYEGPVKSIMPYGAFVEIIPGTDGLIHVSELEWRKVDKVEDVLKEGQMVKFKVVGKDPKSGKLKLSRKVLLEKPEQAN